jgi:hypothetical protein
LALVICARAQTNKPQMPAPAGVSCTSQVPSLTCQLVTQAFHISQQTSRVMRQVEVVIADEESFRQESERLRTETLNMMNAFPSRIERSKLTLPSPFDDSILFELGDVGSITKVVILDDQFNKLNEIKDAKGISHIERTKEIDSDSLLHWSMYVMGYVDGCEWSRMHTLAEALELTHSK